MDRGIMVREPHGQGISLPAGARRSFWGHLARRN
jgi:hypothetical protein